MRLKEIFRGVVLLQLPHSILYALLISTGSSGLDRESRATVATMQRSAQSVIARVHFQGSDKASTYLTV